MRNDRERDSKAAVLREVFAEATNFFDERKESVLLPVRHAHEKERDIWTDSQEQSVRYGLRVYAA